MQHRRHDVCLFRQQQKKVQLVTQRCTAPRISGTTSSAEMHNVLDPHGTSVNVAGRRAERRGPKTCLQKSRTWNQLAPCGLQPGPWRSVAWQWPCTQARLWRCFTAMQTPSLSRMTSGQVSSCGQWQWIFRKCLADILGGPQVVRHWHLFMHLAWVPLFLAQQSHVTTMWRWVQGLTNSFATRRLCAVLWPHGPRCRTWLAAHPALS